MRPLYALPLLSLACSSGSKDPADGGADSIDDTGSAGESVPVDPEGDLSAGHSHTCGVSADGSVVCWGTDEGDWDFGQVREAPEGTFLSVSVGGYFSCGVRTSGGLHSCWGEDKEAPATGAQVLAYINAGVDHACAIKPGGEVFCWGDNLYGESMVPAGRYLQISAGYRHTCGIRDDGTTACWGRDQKGQSSPPEVALAQVSAGAYQTCGIQTNGALVCWGEDYDYSPPDGTFTQVSTARSGTHACALDTEGQPHCWGYDEFGQAQPPDRRFTTISAGGTHSCGRTEEGEFICWGNDIYGQASPP